MFLAVAKNISLLHRDSTEPASVTEVQSAYVGSNNGQISQATSSAKKKSLLVASVITSFGQRSTSTLHC